MHIMTQMPLTFLRIGSKVRANVATGAPTSYAVMEFRLHPNKTERTPLRPLSSWDVQEFFLLYPRNPIHVPCAKTVGEEHRPTEGACNPDNVLDDVLQVHPGAVQTAPYTTSAAMPTTGQ